MPFSNNVSTIYFVVSTEVVQIHIAMNLHQTRKRSHVFIIIQNLKTAPDCFIVQQHGQVLTLDADQVLVEEGCPPGDIYVIISGVAKVRVAEFLMFLSAF